MRHLQDTPWVHRLLYVLLGTLSVALFLKNAWVAEDAYILLRSADQFLQGHGFRWNPQDRAQVYTSPLWFLLVIAATAFSKTLYLDLIGLSLALHIALLVLMAGMIRHVWRWAAAVLLLSLSQAFFDFTASGLEYPLVYFLTGSFVLFYLRNRPVEDRWWLAGSAGLALITRHDLLFILAPMLLHLGIVLYRQLPRRALLATLAVFLAPLACWTLFSLLYYGVPFPNTAYAKLAITGVSRLDRLTRGYIYLTVSLQTDPITPITLALATLHLLSGRLAHLRMLGAGILAGFLYVTWIGGDYMIGRFYAQIYLPAVLGLTVPETIRPFSGRVSRALLLLPAGQLFYWFLADNMGAVLWLLQLLHWPVPASTMPVMLSIGILASLLAIAGWYSPRCSAVNVAVFLMLLFYSTQQNDSPWQTPYKNWGKTADNDLWWMLNTVSRERYWIYQWTSLHSWIERDPDAPFPDHPWCHEGRDLPSVSLVRFSGMMCYCMGTGKIAIDVMGLTDPFIARMPKNPEAPWSSGGAPRVIPEGYLASLEQQRNLISDPDLARYYDKLALITQSDALFAPERLVTILAFNLGAYDHWLNAYKARALEKTADNPLP